ncbi:MAG TPA: hypothetical protein PLE78_01155 [Flavobacteriales bacterium]|nr:hypothetical protein [Flavobacteriales bacterium]HQW39558.1 hypothetical protein [Flavobacteriales bacterium]
MIPLFWVEYHGEVGIDYWEYMLSLLYLLFFYMYFTRQKNMRMVESPEYKFYITGLMAKMMGGLAFSLVYFYYYQGGDALVFFLGGVAMRNLALVEPLEYLRQMLGDNSYQSWTAYTFDTAKPFKYVFFDDRTFAVIRASSILAFLTFKSFLISNLMIASASYFGIWACYRTFVSYFPQLAGRLATGFLFMPSSIFWGSAILKDTFTFSAVCWWVHSVDQLFFKRKTTVSLWFAVIASALVMIAMKPYIFMILFPMTILWLMYFRMVALRNVLVKFVIVPLAVAMVFAVSLLVLTRLGSSFDKFALDGALQTIQVTQGDLVNASAYGSNSFDVGKIDGTWGSVLSKFPVATNAALFRPYIWESNNMVMVLSGLENLWVLGLTLYAFYVAGPKFFFRASLGIPILMMSMAFALLFAFMVGVTTPNFGALVRFKIPMVPFYISSLFIIIYLAKLKRKRENQGLRFDLKGYRMGTAHLLLNAKEETSSRKKGPEGKRSVGGPTGQGRHR